MTYTQTWTEEAWAKCTKRTAVIKMLASQKLILQVRIIIHFWYK